MADIDELTEKLKKGILGSRGPDDIRELVSTVASVHFLNIAVWKKEEEGRGRSRFIKSRSVMFGIETPEGIKKIVLAGLTDEEALLIRDRVFEANVELKPLGKERLQ